MPDFAHPSEPDDDLADLLSEGWLVSFGQDVRFACSGPVPVPTPELAALLEHGVVRSGLSIEKGDLLATAASNVHGPAPQVAGLPKWRKEPSMPLAFLSALFGKIAGAGAVAKAAVATVTAAATMTVAGAAAGVLPGPVQGAVGGAINAVSPLNVPTGEADKIVQTATDLIDKTLASVPGGPVSAGANAQTPVGSASVDGSANLTNPSIPGVSIPNVSIPGVPIPGVSIPNLPGIPNLPIPALPDIPDIGPIVGSLPVQLPACVKNLLPTSGGAPNPTALLAQIPACIQSVLATNGLPANVSQCVASVLGTVSGVLNPGAIGSLPQLNVSACVPLDVTACTSSVLAATNATNAPFVGDMLRSIFGSFGGGAGTGGSSFWGNLGFNLNLPGLNAIPAGCTPIDVAKCLTSVTGSLGTLPASGGVPQVNLSACMPTGLTSGLSGLGGGIPGLSGLPFFPF